MNRRIAWLPVVLALATAARAQETPDDERVDDPRGAPETREALRARLLACVEADGPPLTPADREAVQDMSAALTPVATRALCAEDPAPGDARAPCAARVREASCEALLAALGPGVPQAPAPTWATGLAHALSARVLTCATAERDGGALPPEDTQALAAFERQLVSALGALAAQGACVANENLLPACAASVAVTACEGLGARLDEDPAALARTLTPACVEMVRCGAAALDDGGAEAEDAAAALSP